MSFKDCLWDGTAVIYERYTEGKALSKDVVTVLSARVAAEERYARDLAAISAKAHSIAQNESIPTAWLQLRESQTALAEAHSTTAKKLQADVVKILQDDIRDRSTQKGEMFEEDKQLHLQLQKHKSATEAALQRYLAASAAAEASRKQFHFAQQDATTPPKKLKGMEAQEAKLTSDAEKAHDAYKQALADLNAYQKTFETSLGALLMKLQALEESRAEAVHKLLKVYIEVNKTLCASISKSNDQCAVVVDQINAEKDLQDWIAANKNGLEPEPLVQYEGYSSQFDDASPEDLPSASKARTMGKSLRKPSTAGGAAGGAPDAPKKLMRQKSLSRLLGNKKGVKKSTTGDVISAPVTSSPTVKRISGTTVPGAGSFGSTGSSPSAGNSNNSSSLQKSSGSAGGATSAATSAGGNGASSSAAASKKGKSGRRARALYEFQASDDTEISFSVGDIITVIRVDDSGWWDCEGKDGEVGLAPGNYMEFIDEAPAAAASTPTSGKSEPKSSKGHDDDETPIEVIDETVEVLSTAAGSKDNGGGGAAGGGDANDGSEEEAEPIGTVTALFDFAGDGEDELPLHVGERIEVYAEVEGWYTGTNSQGQYGLFPKNFTGPLEPIKK